MLAFNSENIFSEESYFEETNSSGQALKPDSMSPQMGGTVDRQQDLITEL